MSGRICANRMWPCIVATPGSLPDNQTNVDQKWRGLVKQVGVYEAKTQLPRLLEEVERGQTVTITRHGKPVARLVPVGGRRRTAGEAIEALLAFREQHTLDGLSIQDLVAEGRRF